MPPVLLIALTLAADPANWVTLYPKEGQLRNATACPLRNELPLAEIAKKEAGARRTRNAAGVSCNGLRVHTLDLKWERPKPGTPGRPFHDSKRLHARAWVDAPRGQDRHLTLVYSLVVGETQLAFSHEDLFGDEGEDNWGDGIYLYLEDRAVAGGEVPRLRLEVTSEPVR